MCWEGPGDEDRFLLLLKIIIVYASLTREDLDVSDHHKFSL